MSSILTAPAAPVTLAARAVVPVAAVAALAADVHTPVPGGLAVAGLLLAVDALAARRRQGLVDRLLVDVGGSVAALVLLGTLLGANGVGLSTSSWVVSLAAAGASGTVTAVLVPPRPAEHAPMVREAGRVRTGVLLTLWVLVAAVVATAAVRISSDSLAKVDRAPLEMSFGRIEGTRVDVVVRSTDVTGPLELRTSAGGTEVSYPLIDVAAGGSETTTVALPATGRFVITLGYPDQSRPLRTLVLDR